MAAAGDDGLLLGGSGEEAHGSRELCSDLFRRGRDGLKSRSHRIQQPPLRRASAHIHANAVKPRQRANGE